MASILLPINKSNKSNIINLINKKQYSPANEFELEGRLAGTLIYPNCEDPTFLLFL